MKYYVVIDTNVIVSGLIAKQDTNVYKVLSLLYSGDIIPLYSKEILDEYKMVLSRDKFNLKKSHIGKFINILKTNGIKVVPQHLDVELPDQDDIIFYELVMDKSIKNNKYLVTGNIKDYVKNPIIMTPDEFIKMVNKQ